MFKLKTIALAASMLLASTGSANAAVFSFTTAGSGIAYGLLGAIDTGAPVYLTNATFQFELIPSMVQQTDSGQEYVSGITSGVATANRISFSAFGTFGRELFNGGATVCFDNAGAAFPTAGFSIQSTCTSAISANGYGSTNGMFTYSGTVIGLTITEGGISSDVPRIVNGVPEPSTWALMLAGFGMVGYAMRRRKVGFTAAA